MKTFAKVAIAVIIVAAITIAIMSYPAGAEAEDNYSYMLSQSKSLQQLDNTNFKGYMVYKTNCDGFIVVYLNGAEEYESYGLADGVIFHDYASGEEVMLSWYRDGGFGNLPDIVYQLLDSMQINREEVIQDGEVSIIDLMLAIRED